MLFRAKRSHRIDVRAAEGGEARCRQGDRDDDAGDGDGTWMFLQA